MIKLTITKTARFDVNRIVNDAKGRAFSRIENELRLLRCPVHHKAPTITRTLDGELQIGACCKTLKDAATARLGR